MRLSVASPPAAAIEGALARALLQGAEPADAALRAWVAQPAFAVYRNTVMKGCIDALAANFPAVERLVGTEWFRSAAAVYVAAHPPTDPCLLRYGDAWPGFLQHFGPAAELPYLPAVARLDILWRDSHAAADAAPLAAAALARIEPERLAHQVLAPHPAARWAWFEACPAYSIWSRNRDDANRSGGELPWRPEGALLTRPHDAVVHQSLDRAGCAFLDACAAGQALALAAERAQAVDADCDLAALMASLLRAGAFAAPPSHST